MAAAYSIRVAEEPFVGLTVAVVIFLIADLDGGEDGFFSLTPRPATAIGPATKKAFAASTQGTLRRCPWRFDRPHNGSFVARSAQAWVIIDANAARHHIIRRAGAYPGHEAVIGLAHFVGVLIDDTITVVVDPIARLTCSGVRPNRLAATAPRVFLI